MKRYFVYLLVILFTFGFVLFVLRDRLSYYLFSPRQNDLLPALLNTDGPAEIEVIATKLNIPWEIVFLPSGDMLVTERSGKVLKLGTETKVIQEIEGVKHIGEGGLLGMTLDPNFADTNYVYIYSTTQDSIGITNRIERYTLKNDTLIDPKTIVSGIKGSANHDGGRIAFGPDGFLYVTTGDAGQSALAQDPNSLNGKILRVTRDGLIPADNPFGNAIYSFGHRNPQGLAWDSAGILWATEHGPSGTQTGHDEVNNIVKGGNYGWPLIKGDQIQRDLIMPVINSGSQDTWAPSGMVYWDGSLFFTGLRGQTLYEAKIGADNKLTLIKHLSQKYGRLRTVVLGPDGYFYIATNNKDGRGSPKADDDLIIKVNPKMFR